METEFITPNGKDSQAAAVTNSRRPNNLWLIIIAALFIIVPFLTWYLTWFGRALSDADVATYLADEKNPRHMQHALSQVAERIERHDPQTKKFYPQVIALSKNAIAEIRKTTAWVMGQDNSAEDFHQALLPLLNDSEPLVRRNAALQLVRFGDASGRPELRAMLEPFEVKSPLSGTIVSLLSQGSKIRSGGLLARIRDASGTVQEFRSPMDGAIGKLSVKEADPVTAGQPIISLTPDRATVSDALRALAYIGTKDDLPIIDAYANNAARETDLRQAALEAAKAIRTRD
jgi:biotin carboxyl carrier protein